MGVLVFPNGTIYDTAKPGSVAKSAKPSGMPSRLKKEAANAAKPNIVEKGLAVDRLQRAARDWLDKANDPMIDHEVRALYAAKAAKAVQESNRLLSEFAGSSPNASQVNEAKALEYDTEAETAERKSRDMNLHPSLRAFYADRAQEHRDSAAALRGQPIRGEASHPVNQEVSVTLPR